MIESEHGGCCRCCFSFIITSGLAAFFLWLSLRAASPVCSIEKFDAFALNKTANSTHKNLTIHYDIKLNNKNKDQGVYYDAVNLTFYYKPNLSFPIGNATHPAFYQGHQKNTHRTGDIEPRGINWENATATVASNGSAVFRVVMVTAVRYKIVFWKTKRHHLKLAADLPVSDQGKLIRRKKNKGIKLTSGVGRIGGSFEILYIMGIFVFMQFL